MSKAVKRILRPSLKDNSMIRIANIHFINHPVLGDLELNFEKRNGETADTILIAGENGTGKSTILNSLFEIVSYKAEFEADVEFEKNGMHFTLNYRNKQLADRESLYVNDESGMSELIITPFFHQKYPTTGIFSDVDINFHSHDISSVTSSVLDEKNASRRSSKDLPTEINQLIIDIQALDDAEVAQAVQANPDSIAGQLKVSKRMSRFTSAFDRMFDDLKYSRINNVNGKKTILFKKNGIEVPIENLSSGEKQIIYRGSFLLRDINSLNGAFVFIDEPEISLHPNWQKRVMDYYKNIFTNENGKQTSQIFVVTHSPFVIHNESRRNDKVIVLERNEDRAIVSKTKLEYYKCSSVEAIQDAFSIHEFNSSIPTVYLEGRTDEKYFNRTIEVYNLEIPFQFKWIGYLDESGQERNTGKDALNKGFEFLVACKTETKHVCLFDCDANKIRKQTGSIYAKSLRIYSEAKMKKGIENALVLDEIDIDDSFYSTTIKPGAYGDDDSIKTFQKMEFCNYICKMDDASLRKVFTHLREEIDDLKSIFD